MALIRSLEKTLLIIATLVLYNENNHYTKITGS